VIAAYVTIDKPGWDWCEHIWKNDTYNDWGFPYFVATCTYCGRKLSSPNFDVYRDLSGMPR
jgi:hypothetical protein